MSFLLNKIGQVWSMLWAAQPSDLKYTYHEFEPEEEKHTQEWCTSCWWSYLWNHLSWSRSRHFPLVLAFVPLRCRPSVAFDLRAVGSEVNRGQTDWGGVTVYQSSPTTGPAHPLHTCYIWLCLRTFKLLSHLEESLKQLGLNTAQDNWAKYDRVHPAAQTVETQRVWLKQLCVASGDNRPHFHANKKHIPTKKIYLQLEQ